MSARPEPDNARRHSLLLQALREFFTDHGFVEVTTPLRLQAPAPEAEIEPIPAGDNAWLRTSPELQMKRLLAAGHERIFQIGPCFRRGEYGRRHRPEFTLLEWYEAGAGYRDLIPFTHDLLCRAADTLQVAADRVARTATVTVAEAFARFADTPLDQALADDRFEEVLVTQVEPALGRDGPTFLLDYPRAHAAFAVVRQGPPPVAERWEVYLDGIELANACTELRDAGEQRRRFDTALAHKRRQAQPTWPVDEAFLAELPAMPPAAGCALGVERLLMALCELDDIAHAFPFPPMCDGR